MGSFFFYDLIIFWQDTPPAAPTARAMAAGGARAGAAKTGAVRKGNLKVTKETR